MYCIGAVASMVTGGDIAVLDSDGIIREFYAGGVMNEPYFATQGPFLTIDGGTDYWCGIQTNGTLSCPSEYGSHFGELTPPTGNTWVQVEVQSDFGCARDASGTLNCWGRNSYGESNEPTGSGYKDVAVGQSFACAVKSDDTLACWGLNASSQATPPTGTFVDVSAGRDFAIGVRTNGTLAVWGSPVYTQVVVNMPTTGTYTRVWASKFDAYAEKSDGTLVGWGYDYLGSVSELPANVGSWAFVNANPSGGSTCGVIGDPGTSGYTEGTAICWGVDETYQDPTIAGYCP